MKLGIKSMILKTIMKNTLTSGVSQSKIKKSGTGRNGSERDHHFITENKIGSEWWNEIATDINTEYFLENTIQNKYDPRELRKSVNHLRGKGSKTTSISSLCVEGTTV